jgi:hypothetical protein
LIKSPPKKRKKISKMRPPILLTHNVVAYCRSCCFPTLYQREQRRKNTQIFIPRGKAAILAICSLHVSGSLPIHFPKKVFFQTSPDDLFGASVSPKPNMALAIFGCAAGKAVFCVGLCVGNTVLPAG